MGDNSFNLVIGVLALVSAAASTFGYYHSRLPSQRMDTFDELLGRTKTLFVTAKEDGLIAGPLQRTINARIKTLESSSLEARALAYGPAQSLGVGLIRRGLSQKIEALIVEARALRLFVAISARQQLQQQGYMRTATTDADLDGGQGSAALWWQVWVYARRWRTKTRTHMGSGSFPA